MDVLERVLEGSNLSEDTKQKIHGGRDDATVKLHQQVDEGPTALSAQIDGAIKAIPDGFCFISFKLLALSDKEIPLKTRLFRFIQFHCGAELDLKLISRWTFSILLMKA